MDKEVAEILAYFSQHASELRKLGKDWGLNDEEIEDCIERAMSVDPKDLPASEITSKTKFEFAARKAWPKFRIFMWFVGVALILGGLFALALQNDEFDHRFSQFVQPVLYPLFRFVRLAAVPLHDKMDFYDSYMEECIVPNPLFKREKLLGDHACENCKSVTTATQFTASSLEQGPLPGPVFTEPVLFKNSGKNVSLETFQSILSTNPFAQLPMQGVKTNLKWASHIKHLLEEGVAEKLEAQPDFYFFWISKLVWTSQLMRKVFPKPKVLEGLEIAIRKSIYISGPRADTFELLANPNGPFSWYMQGWGTRRLVLTPVGMCQKECSPVTITLSAGDMVTFSCDMYRADLHSDGEDISIGFLGHFTPRD